MTPRFLADEDIDSNILHGLRSWEPAVDILDVKNASLRGMADPALLELAAQQDRILITHDRHTMTRHFLERIAAGKSTSGLFIAAPRRHRRDHRVASPRVDCVPGGRVAQPDRVSAFPVNVS